jgi:hypothetical protein
MDVYWYWPSNSSFSVDLSCFNVSWGTSTSISKSRAAGSVSILKVVASYYREAAEVSNSRSATWVSNSRAAAEVSSWRVDVSVSTSHLEYPAPYTRSTTGKGDEECMWQESYVAAEDVIEGNKRQETTERVRS